MNCQGCKKRFKPEPWPSTHQKYCTRDCGHRAWYEANKAHVFAKSKEWVRNNRARRLQIQKNWNDKPSAKKLKAKWYKDHYKEWYARIRANGKVYEIHSRTTARRIMKRSGIPKICARKRGEHGGRIECHHRDGDCFNNRLSNLQWLCFRHHQQHHHRLRTKSNKVGLETSSPRS